MKEVVEQVEKDFKQYKLFLGVLFTLVTTDETGRTLYESLLAAEELIKGIEDKRIHELYSRVVEDSRESISRPILESDYRLFFNALIKKADEVEAMVDKGIATLKIAHLLNQT